jgi:hypothetical protein
MITKTKRPNRPTAETPAHRKMEADVAAYVAHHGTRVRGMVIRQDKPATQDSGPVATSTNIWFDRVGRDDWPGLVTVECRRDNQGRYSARWCPRPRVNLGLSPLPVDDALGKAAANVVAHLEGYLGLGARFDPAHVPEESPTQRRRRVAAEAQAQAQAELNDFLELLAEGGGEE